MPELPRDVLLDMQRSIGNRAVAAVVDDNPPPPTIARSRSLHPVPDLPPEARREEEPHGTWVAPFDLGVARDCGTALAMGLRLRSRLQDGVLRRDLTMILRDLGEDPDRPLTREQALGLAIVGVKAAR